MRTRKNISWLISIICIAVVAALVWKLYFSRPTEEPTPDAPLVTVANPVVKDVTKYDYFTGTTESIASVEIRTRLEGFLDSVEFMPSTDVNEGDLMFIVEPDRY